MQQLAPLPPDADCNGVRVRVVDDDMRNIFAITSVLENRGMKVYYQENGRVAVKMMAGIPDLDVVLMDTMTPEMDGMDATRVIREMPHFQTLPIIPLAAKAMKGDREKALAAGASDGISKPVDLDVLLSVIRNRMLRSQESRRAVALSGAGPGA